MGSEISGQRPCGGAALLRRRSRGEPRIERSWPFELKILWRRKTEGQMCVLRKNARRLLYSGRPASRDRGVGRPLKSSRLPRSPLGLLSCLFAGVFSLFLSSQGGRCHNRGFWLEAKTNPYGEIISMPMARPNGDGPSGDHSSADRRDRHKSRMPPDSAFFLELQN